MKRKPRKFRQAAFAGVVMDGKKPHIMAWSVSGSASHVRHQIGRSWCKEDPREGWKAAKIEGIRVVKVDLCATL